MDNGNIGNVILQMSPRKHFNKICYLRNNQISFPSVADVITSYKLISNKVINNY